MSASRLNAMRWGLLCGNFFIGCGVMVVGGALNDLSADLHVSVTAIGHMIAVAAIMMGVGAPIMATLLSRIDRRLLLPGALLWYGVGHGLSAVCSDYEWLLPVRALTVLAAAVFTPQAAAAVGMLAPLPQRGRAITFVFLGWSAAAVVGMPLAAWIGERLGWQVAMSLVGAGSLITAWWLYRLLPAKLLPPATSLRAWQSVLSSPVLMATVLVTALQSAGQMTMVAYSAAYLKSLFGATPEEISLMLAYFGSLSLMGVLVLNRWIDRFTASRAVNLTLGMMCISMAAWPLGHNLTTLAVVLLPWALAGFATSSGQQARLSHLSPEKAPALMSLNTSAIYTGHAVGAFSGGWIVSHHGYRYLNGPALVWALLALALSLWAYRASQRQLPPAMTVDMH